MAIVTTHTCDRCGHSQDAYIGSKEPDRRTMRLICIAISRNEHQDFTYNAGHHKALWCDQCLIDTGIIRLSKQPENPQPPEPSFEDKLREFIREEISNAQP